MTEPATNTIPNYRVILSIVLPCLLGWGMTYLSTNVFRDYAVGLFIWLPVVMGAISTILVGYKTAASRKLMRNISFINLAIFCFGLLSFAWEGVICLIMAAPLGLLFTYIGHGIGYVIIKGTMKDNTTITAAVLLVVSVPSLMAFEHIGGAAPDLRSVTTSIEIDASPETVWKNVIVFPPLGSPTEFIFRTGIAYPINAEISGQGVGAVRHCNFSTGSFVEPISVWEATRLLKFDVDSQPEPLKELSFYSHVHPNHLHGYWVSKGGQFKLTALPNGHTLLEGTTWYINKIEPGVYWTLWSDYIVHKIHERVLGQIKVHAERG